MKQIAEYPPIYEKARKVFDIDGRNVIFAYGDAIYNPRGVIITPDLEVHEGVHLKQQAAIGGPEIWWDRYLSDPKFRLEQEVEAYRAQYAYFIRHNKNRQQQFDFLKRIAGDLSSSMYRCDIHFHEAMRRIR